MKLDHDCVRDVMLTIEEEFNLNTRLHAEQFSQLPRLKDYPYENVLYALIKLKEGGLINAGVLSHSDGTKVIVSSLTYEGHQLLDNIRDNAVWQKTKQAASKLESVSLSILGELAVIYVKQFLGLN